MKKLFTIVMLALLTGCSEKPPETPEPKTPDAKTAPVSKIDFDDPKTRKKIAAEAIYKNQSQRRGNKGEELVYFRDQQTPYTGWWKEMRGKGNGYPFATLVQYKDGKIDGPMAQWYKNGQKRREATHRKGEKMFTSSWHENGQKKYVHYYKDNKQDGLWTEWYENGQKRGESTFKDGKKDGLQTWWYENGQKRGESTWKDGKIMTSVVWKPNGEKCPVTNVVNGNGAKVWYNNDGTEKERKTYREGELVSD